MTEENQDATPPKLRLSGQPKEPVSEKAPAEDQNPEPEPTGSADSDYDPKHPFKEPSGASDSSPTGTSAGSSASAIDSEEPAKKIENTVNQMEEGNKSSSMLTSFIVIILLLGILGGAGYGLYYLFNASEGTADSSAEESADAQNEASGPISKAKEAISKVPGAESIPTGLDTTATDAGSGAGGTQAKAGTTTAGQSTVSEFLKNAHIGGVRTGERPMLILNGQSYMPGATVNEEYDLRFIGFVDEKLAFRDNQNIVYVKSF